MRHRLEARKRNFINYNMIWTYKCQILLSQGGSAVLGNEKPLKGRKNPPGATIRGALQGEFSKKTP